MTGEQVDLAPLTRPARLRAGARVAVVSPSGPVPVDRLEPGLDLLRGWGLDPVVMPHVLDVHPELDYLAGTDGMRARDLQDAWCDPSVDAVICARGGYGVHRMVDLVDWAAMRAAGPKVFVGYSDITVLHEAFALRTGLATLQGPMVGTETFLKDPRTQESLRATLFEPETVMTLGLDGARALVPGRARGITYGGCVSLLAADLATPTAAPRPAAGCWSSRTPPRTRTASTASSPSCCGPGRSMDWPEWPAVRGRAADRTRRSGRSSPTGSARWAFPSWRSSVSDTAPPD